MPSQKSNTTVARVPIKNIWLLLLYSSDFYRTLGKKQQTELEANPEELVDLAAKMYCEMMNRRFTQALSYGYQKNTCVINRVRGKIDVLTTASKQLIEKGQIQCCFDELTIDTPKNRYIHAAAHELLKQLENPKWITQCKKIIHQFKVLKIGQNRHYHYLTDQFDRINPRDKTLVSLSRLIFSLSIPTELNGSQQFEQVNKSDHWLRHLFEKAVIGFMKVNFDKNEWKISPREQLFWQHAQATTNLAKFLPTMLTDLVVEHQPCQHRLVVDTKCTSILNNSRFKREHIFQLYAYVSSYDHNDPIQSVTTSGMLLYPAIGRNIHESAVIQNHKLTFCTIDLTQDSAAIRENLLTLLSECGCKATSHNRDSKD